MLQVIEFKTQTSKLKVQADLRLKIQPQTFHPKPFTLDWRLSGDCLETLQTFSRQSPGSLQAVSRQSLLEAD